MSKELISKQNLIKELKSWLTEFEGIPETLYGQGYDDAIKAAIAIVENEMPLKASKLPCKIGDTIYKITRRKIKKWEVVGFTCYESGKILLLQSYPSSRMVKMPSYEIGVTIFLTLEEAERALEELRNE